MMEEECRASRGGRSRTKDTPMTPLVVLTLSLLAQQPARSATERTATAPSPAEIVASIESVMADAIAKAEPSVVAIDRHKAQDPNRTLAVRGRTPQQPAVERDRLELLNNPRFGDDYISFDYGSGVVIGEDGEILTAFHVVRGAEWLKVQAPGAPAFRRGGHRRRPAQRPGRHRARAGTRRRAAASQADRDRRRDQAAQGVVPDRAGQPVQRGPGRRRSVGELGHPLQHRRGGSRPAATRPARRSSPTGSRITRPCSSSTPSSTWA